METEPVSMPLSLKLRVPADIVFITLPLLCWALVIFRWCGLWLTQPWLVGLTVVYYALAAAYLVFAVIVRMRIVEIVGLFVLLAACIFIWLPLHWVLAVLLLPALFMAFYKRGNKRRAIIVTAIISFFVLLPLFLTLMVCSVIFHNFSCFIPDRYAYHASPNGEFTAVEHASYTLFGGTDDVVLYRANGPLLSQKRDLCLSLSENFGGSIEWLDERTIRIYGEQMDIFKDDPMVRRIFG